MKRYNIPRNFEAGVSFLGMTFKGRNLIEGAVLFVFLFGTVYLATESFSFDVQMTAAIFVSVPVAAVAINGIHGDPLTTRVSVMLQYIKKKRSCFYNPRLKTEQHPTDLGVSAFNLLPRDKLNLFYANFKSANDKKKTESLRELEKEREAGMFFQDDEGVLDKPYDYMTAKEQKTFDREQKKKERRQRKNEKKQRKKDKKKAR